jgi:uncharacterized protein (DUF2345 family)
VEKEHQHDGSAVEDGNAIAVPLLRREWNAISCRCFQFASNSVEQSSGSEASAAHLVVAGPPGLRLAVERICNLDIMIA